ncbi:myb-like protein X [Limulus polyphemus]|uniref:Myb-like protein X n=1 Tax=Limulus polyphemus TaxID=6850 RepID=A0ABM1SLE0_LIMPO|nr:myb-like protein X [Limulus polyphemus]
MRRDADVQVQIPTPELQREVNVATTKEREQQYYFKESVESTSNNNIDNNDGEEQKRMRPTIITNVYVTASGDNKKKREGKQRVDYGDGEASDEDGVDGFNRKITERRRPGIKPSYIDESDSDVIRVHEDNESIILDTLKNSRTKRNEYKEKGDREQDDKHLGSSVTRQNDKDFQQEIKDRKDGDVKDISESGSKETGSKREERCYKEIFKGHREREASIEEDSHDEAKQGKPDSLEVKKYERNNKITKVTEKKRKSQSRNQMPSSLSLPVNTGSKKEDDEADIPKENSMQDNQQKKMVKNVEGNSGQFEDNTKDSLKQNGEKVPHFQMRSHEGGKNKKNDLQEITTVEETEVLSRVTKAYMQENNKYPFQEKSDCKHGLGKSEILLLKKETNSPTTSTITECENFNIPTSQKFNKRNKNQPSSGYTFTTEDKGSKVKLKTEKSKRLIQHKEDMIDDDELLEDKIESIGAGENQKSKQTRSALKSLKRNSLLLTEDALEQVHSSKTQSSNEKINDPRQSTACDNCDRPSSKQNVYSTGKESEGEELGEMNPKCRMKKKLVSFEVAG